MKTLAEPEKEPSNPRIPQLEKWQHREKFTSVLREPNKNVYTEERAVRYVERERKALKEIEKDKILMAKLDAEYQAYLRQKDESITSRQTDITRPESNQHSSQKERQTSNPS
jgi:hypothetical protein